MFGSTNIAGGGSELAFTHRLTRADLTCLTGIEVTVHQFQRWVPKAYDAQVVVIGQRLFGFAIHADTPPAQVDFRLDYRNLRYDFIEVPHEIAEGVHRLMVELELMFAAIDFVVDPDGHWVFIGDVKPCGQYGWLETATGVPLTDHLADLLTEGIP